LLHSWKWKKFFVEGLYDPRVVKIWGAMEAIGFWIDSYSGIRNQPWFCQYNYKLSLQVWSQKWRRICVVSCYEKKYLSTCNDSKRTQLLVNKFAYYVNGDSLNYLDKRLLEDAYGSFQISSKLLVWSIKSSS
jgi:hypothetical protein